MNYKIENENLIVTVSDMGAQLVSVINKTTKEEYIWQADDDRYWQGQAPLLFPNCGKLKDNTILHNGVNYEGNPQHGFSRVTLHKIAAQNDDNMTFSLLYNDELLSKYPFKFELLSTFSLKGNVLTQKITVKNLDDSDMYFSVGFHPAFNCPFDDKHTVEDYDIVFSDEENLKLVEVNNDNAMCTGNRPEYTLVDKKIPLHEDTFDNDSINLEGVKSKIISLVERDTGKKITVDINGLPYLLLWSCGVHPTKFVCIEPWQGLPDNEAGGEFKDKEGIVKLESNSDYECSIDMGFIR